MSDAGVSVEPVVRKPEAEYWHGKRVVAYHWQQPSGLPLPSSQTIDRVAFHWSTGPKDAERLIRMADASDAIQAAVAAERARYKPLLSLILDGDHERGCEGRAYACGCQYDDNVYGAAHLIATAIEGTDLESPCHG